MRNLSKRFFCFFLCFLLIGFLFVSVKPVKGDDTNLGPAGTWNNWFDDVVSIGSFEGKTAVYRLDWTQSYVNIGFSATAECDSPFISVSVGDHIVLSAWFWVPDSVCGENGLDYNGGFLRLDMYGSSGRIAEIGTPSGAQTVVNGVYNPDGYLTYVKFGTKTWTQIIFDFTVQSSYLSDGWGGLPQGVWSAPTGFFAFCGIGAFNLEGEQVSVYFADTEIYVNPSSSPTPTPSPSVTPTPPPIPTPAPYGPVTSSSPSPTPISSSSNPNPNSGDLSGIASAFGALMVIAMVSAMAESMTKTKKNR